MQVVSGTKLNSGNKLFDRFEGRLPQKNEGGHITEEALGNARVEYGKQIIAELAAEISPKKISAE